VAQIIGYNRFYIHFNRSLNDTLSQQLNTNYNILSTIYLDITEDIIRWRWCNTGIFSIHSCYQWLDFGGVKQFHYQSIWQAHIPLKIKIFL
jgi:hypothetical protein